MKLITYPNDFLEKRVDPFDFETQDAKQIEKDMIEIMEKHQGVGLAANQVEFNGQIFIIKPTGSKGYEDEKPFAIINPKMINNTTKAINTYCAHSFKSLSAATMFAFN